MAIAKIESLERFDLGTQLIPWEQRRSAGKKLRRAVPRELHGKWQPAKDRPDPLKLLAESNKGRQSALNPAPHGTNGIVSFCLSAWLGLRHGGRSLDHSD